MARLVVNREEADLVTHELTRDIVTIGSAPLNHIVIDDPAVSAQHAIVARVADSYRLKDLHSTNGTQVNGISITDAELKDGDKIQFGSVVAVFCGTLQTLMKQMSSSLAGPLIFPGPAQIERESPMATAQISPPSSRKLTLIAVAIAVLMCFRDRFRTFHDAPDGPPCCWSSRASLLGGFSGNSAHHSADNSADRSCYATSRSSGDSTNGLFWDRRDLDVFG